MNATEDELRAALARRADQIQSRLTLADIRDQGLRAHVHRPRLVAPALVAAAVALVVVVISLVGRGDDRSVPPVAPPIGHTVLAPVTSSSTPRRATTAPTQVATPQRATTPTATPAPYPTSTTDTGTPSGRTSTESMTPRTTAP